MERNLLRRVETGFPILDPELAAARATTKRWRTTCADNLNAWELHADGDYRTRARPATTRCRIRRRARCWRRSVHDERDPSPARAPPPLPLQDGDLLAAVDLGSNSFHMVVARYVLGQLRIVDRLRETVRLAEGLDGKGGLDARRARSARSNAWRASASACATSRRSACARSPPTPCASCASRRRS